MSHITVTYIPTRSRWEARFPWSLAAKDQVKSAGFRFDGTTKVWWTKDEGIAMSMASPEARQAQVERDSAALAASRATDANVKIPAPAGLAYLPFQRAGIAYASNKRAVLIGDEMGRLL